MSDAYEPGFVAPGGKDPAIPRFYLRPVQNNFMSEQEGRPIFDEKEYVEIIIPGNRGTTVDERVKQEHRDRWPQFYAAFKAGQELAPEGTALEHWPPLIRAQVEELKHFNIRTVEQIAALDDASLSRAIPMGGNALRDKAKRWLAEAAGHKQTETLAAENAAQQARMSAMENTIKELGEQLAEERRLRLAGVRADPVGGGGTNA